MAGMNMLAALGSYAFGASAASGVSLTAISYTFPNGLDTLLAGSMVLCIKNTHTADPVHVEMRSIWTDVNGVSQTTTIGVALSGTSAPTIQKLIWVGSSEGVVIPYTNIVGSALKVVVLNAISGTAGTGASGTVSLWGL